MSAKKENKESNKIKEVHGKGEEGVVNIVIKADNVPKSNERQSQDTNNDISTFEKSSGNNEQKNTSNEMKCLPVKIDNTNISETTIVDGISTKLNGKTKDYKDNKKRQNPVSSISISKLEDELDSLPMPEFPSIDIERELVVLPMSEFPAPEAINSKESEEILPSEFASGAKDNVSPNTCLSLDKELTSHETEKSDKFAKNIGARNRKSSVKSMEDNLESLSNTLKSSTDTFDGIASGNQKIPNACNNVEKIKTSNDIENSTSHSIDNTIDAPPEVKILSTSDEKLSDGIFINNNPSLVRAEKVIKEEDKDSVIQKEEPELGRKPSIKYKRKSENNNEENKASLPNASPAEPIKPSAVICRIKNKANNDRRNSLAKTLTRLEPYLLVASSPPEGIRSQRLAELGVSCVVHAATIMGDTKKGKGMIISYSEGIDIVNANLEDGGNNLEIFEAFGDKISEVQKKKGVALIISDESSPSINQR